MKLIIRWLNQAWLLTIVITAQRILMAEIVTIGKAASATNHASVIVLRLFLGGLDTRVALIAGAATSSK
ncbi:hypothetical protein [Piscirickettsia litoralis]|uniref:Secreted protein n=1 Tax=Piscirickettsia litoralis TaxID=1891921 RepID=A0ABX3A0H6_9GAMM|nr:hypothetical protein [Piscirickettsia litoralis]ODN41958.1 hypothetical protein BGC07_02015 [Piscirickettsia litoralis]